MKISTKCIPRSEYGAELEPLGAMAPQAGELVYQATDEQGRFLGFLALRASYVQDHTWEATDVFIPDSRPDVRTLTERALFRDFRIFGEFLEVNLGIPSDMANGSTKSLLSVGFVEQGNFLRKEV
jgi:hypothetical protein